MSKDAYKQVRTTQERESQPRKRKLFGVPTAQLQVDPIPGYHLYWANDEGSRIAFMQECGYDFVRKEEINSASIASDLVERPDSVDGNLGDRVCRLVSRSGTVPIYAYLMKVPEEIYLESKTALAAIADKNDNSIRAGGMTGGDGSGNYYTPNKIRLGRK